MDVYVKEEKTIQGDSSTLSNLVLYIVMYLYPRVYNHDELGDFI